MRWGRQTTVVLVHFLLVRQTSSQERLFPTCFACGCSTCQVGNYEGRVPIPEEIRDQVGGFSEISCFQLSQAGLVGLIPPDICNLNRDREVQQACQCPPLPPSLSPTEMPSLSRSEQPTGSRLVSALPSESAWEKSQSIEPTNETANVTASPSAEPTDEASQPSVQPTLIRPLSPTPSLDKEIASTESAEPSVLSTEGTPSPPPNSRRPSFAPIARSVLNPTLRLSKTLCKSNKLQSPPRRKKSGHKADSERKSDKRCKGETSNSKPKGASKKAFHKKVRSGSDAREKLTKQQ